jgi:hypothetical protein
MFDMHIFTPVLSSSRPWQIPLTRMMTSIKQPSIFLIQFSASGTASGGSVDQSTASGDAIALVSTEHRQTYLIFAKMKLDKSMHYAEYESLTYDN